MGLSDEQIRLRAELKARANKLRATYAPRPPWWRPFARRRWNRWMAGVEQRAIERMRAEIGADPDACQYFTRYCSDDDVPGECTATTTLELVDGAANPPIRVCEDHAATIAARFPTLGGCERFAPILRSV